MKHRHIISAATTAAVAGAFLVAGAAGASAATPDRAVASSSVTGASETVPPPYPTARCQTIAQVSKLCWALNDRVTQVLTVQLKNSGSGDARVLVGNITHTIPTRAAADVTLRPGESISLLATDRAQVLDVLNVS